MKISFNWLKQYIDFTESIEDISTILTNTGLEVEGTEKVEQVKGGLQGLVIGKVLTCESHPNADKLKVTTVDIGTDTPAPIVCGAPNVATGQTVIVATIGTTLYPTSGEEFKIKKAKIRGEVSEGMICAEDEIGIGSDHDGIMVIDTKVPVGSPAALHFQFEDDYTIEIGLTPNRADATSHIGVARDLKAVLKTAVNWPSVDNFKVDNHELEMDVSVLNSEACPRYSGVTLTGITIKDSPDWLKQRLISVGLTPINNIVDITNFVLHETGQPLHAFDAGKITGSKIIVKTLAAGSKFVTLDDQERVLVKDDLMICNDVEGMCIAGVLGGVESGVTDTTKSIFLESAYFSADYVRKTSLQHQIKTDASFRFERGTDPENTVYALKRAAMLIKEVAGGNISSDIVDIYPEPINDFKVPVKNAHISRLLGKEIPNVTVEEILNNLDIKVEQITADGFLALVPPYRVDVQREADVIEEILRIYGFDNIGLPLTVGADFLAEFNPNDSGPQQKKISEYLVGNGFYEIMTNSLTKPEYVEWTSSLQADNNVEILNKLSEDLGVMKQSMLFTGLEVMAYNINRRQRDLKLFEFGKIYAMENKSYNEFARLGIFMTGLFAKESWMNSKEDTGFHHLSGLVSGIFSKLNISGFSANELDNDLFDYGLTYNLKGRQLGMVGMVNHKILKKIGIKQEVFYADLDWGLLFSYTIDNIVVERPSRFPEVRRDLSLVIDKSLEFKDIFEVVRKTEKKLIKELDIFDIYEGNRLEHNKKAYSLKFILEDKEKTLTDKLIDKTMRRLMSAFERELGALIRQ